jgi:hypothetical protein
VSRREFSGWILCSVLVCAVHGVTRPTPLATDSYQYLSVASNLLHGEGLTTPLVHFDTERSTGRLPAPLTTFAPAYPLILAAAAPLSGAPERAGEIVSALCFVAAFVILGWLGIVLGLETPILRLLFVLWLLNAYALAFSNAVLTEPVFLVTSTGAVLAFVISTEAETARSRYIALAAAHVLVGLSYWIRYAGLFLFAAVCVYSAARWLLRRDRENTIAVAFCALSGAFVVAVMARNFLTVGTWRGGNEKVVHNAAGAVLVQYLRSQVHLLFGEHKLTAGIPELLFGAGLLAAAILTVVAFQRARVATGTIDHRGWIIVLLYVLVYSAGIQYLGMRSVIDLQPRMLYPILPLLLLLVGAVLQIAWNAARVRSLGPAFGAALVACAAGYGLLNARDFTAPGKRSLDESLRMSLEEPVGGVPLRQWLDANLAPDEPIAATAGQPTGYVLKRKTLSLVGSQYSNVAWNETTVRQLMRRYGVRYLILYRNLPEDIEPVRAESPFVAHALNGSVDSGFRVAAENRDVRVLRLDSN